MLISSAFDVLMLLCQPCNSNIMTICILFQTNESISLLLLRKKKKNEDQRKVHLIINQTVTWIYIMPKTIVKYLKPQAKNESTIRDWFRLTQINMKMFHTKQIPSLQIFR